MAVLNWANFLPRDGTNQLRRSFQLSLGKRWAALLSSVKIQGKRLSNMLMHVSFEHVKVIFLPHR
jgi:hypothetical protein